MTPVPAARTHAGKPAPPIVKIALTRPYTFIVMTMPIVLATPFALWTMPTDIFPDNIPAMSIIWNYIGLPAREIDPWIDGQTERGLTMTGRDIEHIESKSLVAALRQRGVLPEHHTVRRRTSLAQPSDQMRFDMPSGPIAKSLEVITTQRSLLDAERFSAQRLGQRSLTAVFMLKALGGNWQGSRLASR